MAAKKKAAVTKEPAAPKLKAARVKAPMSAVRKAGARAAAGKASARATAGTQPAETGKPLDERMTTAVAEIKAFAKKQGFLTYQDIEANLSEDTSPEDMDEIFAQLSEAKIDVFDSAEEAHKKQERKSAREESHRPEIKPSAPQPNVRP